MAITGKCAHCGAQIVFDKGTTVVKCDYCDSINVVQDFLNIPLQTIEVSTANKEPQLREIVPELKFAANYKRSFLNTQGGHLWINDEDVFFKPHKYNLGSLDKLYIHIPNICGFTLASENYFNQNLTFYTNDNKSLTVLVWSMSVKSILQEVELRRRKFYESKGMAVPPLTNCDSACIKIIESSDKDSLSFPTKNNNSATSRSTKDNSSEGGKANNNLWKYVGIGVAIIILIQMCS